MMTKTIPYKIKGKTLGQWISILGWQGGTIHQVEQEINDEHYIIRKLSMIEGLLPYDKVRINKNEAVLISIQNSHELPALNKMIIHSRQTNLLTTFIAKDDSGYMIGYIK